MCLACQFYNFFIPSTCKWNVKRDVIFQCFPMIASVEWSATDISPNPSDFRFNCPHKTSHICRPCRLSRRDMPIFLPVVCFVHHLSFLPLCVLSAPSPPPLSLSLSFRSFFPLFVHSSPEPTNTQDRRTLRSRIFSLTRAPFALRIPPATRHRRY